MYNIFQSITYVCILKFMAIEYSATMNRSVDLIVYVWDPWSRFWVEDILFKTSITIIYGFWSSLNCFIIINKKNKTSVLRYII